MVIWSHSRQGKTPSYRLINTVILLQGIYICTADRCSNVLCGNLSHHTTCSRAREIDKCQSVRLFSKWSAISGRIYRNSRLEVYVRIYVTFEFRKSLDRGYRREFWCIYLYIAASLFTKYLSIFLDVLSAERILKQNKNTSEFPRINLCYFRRQAHSSSSVRVQSVK